MELWPVLKGALTRVPGLYRTRAAALGGSISSRYCYGVWLRHVSRLHAAGMRGIPSTVAELGPGLSLGVGLAALLSGTDRYVALDMARDAAPGQQSRMLDEIAGLLTGHVAIPDDREFPELLPRLSEYAFPHGLEAAASGATGRLPAVRELLESFASGESRAGALSLSYRVPWTEDRLREPVDLVVAQAVLEHVDDPAAVYQALAQALRPGAFLSATIDFRSHGLTRAWNGHWAYSERTWRVVRGARHWGINRWPLRRHLDALDEAGFRVLEMEREVSASTLSVTQIEAGYGPMELEDARTCSAYVIAMRR